MASPAMILSDHLKVLIAPVAYSLLLLLMFLLITEYLFVFSSMCIYLYKYNPIIRYVCIYHWSGLVGPYRTNSKCVSCVALTK